MHQEKTTSPHPVAPVRILAIASGGGHWHELLRLRPAFEGCDLHFIGIDPNWKPSVAPAPFHVVPDAHFDEPLRMIRTFFYLLRLFRRIHPQAVVSTGAAPGGLAMLLGRIFGARTLWVDSAANCTILSRSGRLAMRIAHTTLTQYSHLAAPEGPFYRGSILP
jgi:UDP-N-acetylglucosamine:LPS N-acetylglucosamine transferase